jgi:hypothetical protein
MNQTRLRRNAGKQALSRLEIGDGLELDSRSRLRVTDRAATVSSGSSPTSQPLLNDTGVNAGVRVGPVTSTTVPIGTTLPQVTADLAALQGEIETFLSEIRSNFSTLTEKANKQ